MKIINALLAGMVISIFSNGVALAAGPLVGGIVPYRGADAFSTFTIDNASFDRTDVVSAPCPQFATCTNSTGTTAEDNFLIREVSVSGFRYIQTIFAESDPEDGDFIYEAAVTSEPVDLNDDDVDDSIGVKQVIDVADTGMGSFYASHEYYRGCELFGACETSPSMVMHQIVDEFQTFHYEGYIPAVDGGTNAGSYRVEIVQDGAGNMPDFAHFIRGGVYGPFPPCSLSIGSESLACSLVGRNHVTATWIGSSSMSGGGPGVLPADGQDQNHDERLAEQRDFGLLIYRIFGSGIPGPSGHSTGNAGGTPDALVQPQFSQSTPAIGEIRAFSLRSDENDSGRMYNVGHGSFVGGADLLDSWDETVFGPSPY